MLTWLHFPLSVGGKPEFNGTNELYKGDTMENQTLASLFSALRDKSSKVRVGAMIALSKYGSVEALPVILEAVNVRPAKLGSLENGWKMQLAIFQIAQKDPEAAMTHLIKSLGSVNLPEQEVAAGVIEALNASEMNLADELFKNAKKKSQG
jgi:HEAT repeat protein